jgi:hypothetical protein
LQSSTPNRKDRWRIPAGVAVLVLTIDPGTAVALVALDPVVGRGWIVLAGAIVGVMISFVVFLVFIYVVAYVVSAAWHDAQNSRRHPRP